MNMRSLVPVLMVLCYACSSKTPPAPVIEATPKALQEKDGYSLSKRGDADVLNGLYNELKEKDPDLKALHQQIAQLARDKPDSLDAYHAFNTKNISYYSSANELGRVISDSTIKREIQRLIRNSLAAYENKTAGLRMLDTQIVISSSRLQDQYALLKLVRTLPLIEKYQNEQATIKAPMAAILEEFKKANTKAVKLTEGH